jgi:hypothetical protein
MISNSNKNIRVISIQYTCEKNVIFFFCKLFFSNQINLIDKNLFDQKTIKLDENK